MQKTIEEVKSYSAGQLIKSYRDEYTRKREELAENEQYTLSENQAQFCNDAEDAGLTIDMTYSGRGMYGRLCPSVVVESSHELSTDAHVHEDSMGRSIVIYASR